VPFGLERAENLAGVPLVAKSQAAVLLAAMIAPSVESWPRVVWRNVTNSYAKYAAQVGTTPPAGQQEECRELPLDWDVPESHGTTSTRDELRRSKQFRADGEIRRPGGVHVDPQVNLSLRRRELNHACALDEVVAIAHDENGPVLQAHENLPEAALLGPADEQDVARRDFIGALVALDPHRPVAHSFGPNHFIQIRAERIVPRIR